MLVKKETTSRHASVPATWSASLVPPKFEDRPEPRAGRRQEVLHEEHVARAGVDHAGDVVAPAVFVHSPHDLLRHPGGRPLVIVVTRQQQEGTCAADAAPGLIPCVPGRIP